MRARRCATRPPFIAYRTVFIPRLAVLPLCSSSRLLVISAFAFAFVIMFLRSAPSSIRPRDAAPPSFPPVRRGRRRAGVARLGEAAGALLACFFLRSDSAFRLARRVLPWACNRAKTLNVAVAVDANRCYCFCGCICMYGPMEYFRIPECSYSTLPALLLYPGRMLWTCVLR